MNGREEIFKTAPKVLTSERRSEAICYAFAIQAEKLEKAIRMINFYKLIERSDEAELDRCAKAMGLDFYFEDYDIETKRKLIKKGIWIKKKRGTEKAVEYVLKCVFGEETRAFYHNDIEAIGAGEFQIIFGENSGYDKGQRDAIMKRAIFRVKRAGIKMLGTAYFDGAYNFNGVLKFDAIAR